MSENPFDAARKAFAEAQRTMEAAALAELARIIHLTYPDAVEAKVHGFYGDEGDFVVDLIAVTTPAGTLSIEQVDELAEVEEEAHDALLYLGTTMSEAYLGEHEVDLQQ